MSRKHISDPSSDWDDDDDYAPGYGGHLHGGKSEERKETDERKPYKQSQVDIDYDEWYNNGGH